MQNLLGVIDLDATIVIAHSEKSQARPTWKKTFGFHPMTAWADHGQEGNGEPLAIMLRPGNAGSNTASDHIETTRLALAQLPRHLRRKVLVRADTEDAVFSMRAPKGVSSSYSLRAGSIQLIFWTSTRWSGVKSRSRSTAGYFCSYGHT